MPVDGTLCANDTATGIGVNLGTSSDLVIYMEGGGACFNAFTCSSVAHPNGFGANDTATLAGYTDGIFDRTDAKNPLKDATFVFVPYCTGDIHAGSNPSGFGGNHQVGYVNVGKDLDYIVPKSTKVARVILTGSSAGGFGSLFNYDRTPDGVRPAAGHAPRRLGPAAVRHVPDAVPAAADARCMDLEPRCPPTVPLHTSRRRRPRQRRDGFVADTYPDRRFGLITSTRDGVIRSFLGFGYPNCASGGNPIPPADFAAAVIDAARHHDRQAPQLPRLRWSRQRPPRVAGRARSVVAGDLGAGSDPRPGSTQS